MSAPLARPPAATMTADGPRASRTWATNACNGVVPRTWPPASTPCRDQQVAAGRRRIQRLLGRADLPGSQGAALVDGIDDLGVRRTEEALDQRRPGGQRGVEGGPVEERHEDVDAHDAAVRVRPGLGQTPVDRRGAEHRQHADAASAGHGGREGPGCRRRPSRPCTGIRQPTSSQNGVAIGAET